MLSITPADLAKLRGEDIDKEILRLGIIAELDAVSLYEQLAAMTTDPKIRAILLDIAGEEKIHVGEFQALLLARDSEQKESLIKGEAETQELK